MVRGKVGFVTRRGTARPSLLDDLRFGGRQHFGVFDPRSEEHTSELQSRMRISYAVFCLPRSLPVLTLSFPNLRSSDLLEHYSAVLLQQFAGGLVVIRGHGGAGLHPSSCSLRRLCPSGTWFAGRSGLSHGGAPPGHRYSMTFDSAVASTSGCSIRRRGPNSG